MSIYHDCCGLPPSDHHSGSEGRKRSGSHGKNISLELIYKSGGLEQKIVLSPSSANAKKTAVEWLRALKKVGVEATGSWTLSGCSQSRVLSTQGD